MARNKTAVKKFIVTLSDEERGALTALIHTGKHPAQKLLKARILLKADASDAGEGWPRRLVERFEWHYTPKHGSWLDMAESELGVLSFQCLDRRIPDQQMLKEEVEACRNKKRAKADWRFTTENARVKLKRLYPAQ